MTARAFVVVTLPAKDTVLGGLTHETSARIELWACPYEDAGLGECYAFTLQASGLAPAEADSAVRRMEEASVVFHANRFEAGCWSASGWIPVENIAQRSFRLLKRLPEGTAPAWVVMKSGLAQVRLRPFSSGPLDGYLRGLADFLKQEGVEGDVDEAHIEGLSYATGLEELASLPREIPRLVMA